MRLPARLLLAHALPEAFPARVLGQAMGHFVEPSADRLLRLQRRRLAGQNQKSSLENVFGVLPVTQNPLAEPQNHWPVPPEQGRECLFVAPPRILLQQLSVGQLVGAPRCRQGPDMPKYELCLTISHVQPRTNPVVHWFIR